MIAIDVFAREVRWQSANRHAVFRDSFAEFLGRESRRGRKNDFIFLCLGNNMHADGCVLRQIERNVRMNGPVAVGGVDVDGHIAILVGKRGIGLRAATLTEVVVEFADGTKRCLFTRRGDAASVVIRIDISPREVGRQNRAEKRRARDQIEDRDGNFSDAEELQQISRTLQLRHHVGHVGDLGDVEKLGNSAGSNQKQADQDSQRPADDALCFCWHVYAPMRCADAGEGGRFVLDERGVDRDGAAAVRRIHPTRLVGEPVVAPAPGELGDGFDDAKEYAETKHDSHEPIEQSERGTTVRRTVMATPDGCRIRVGTAAA